MVKQPYYVQPWLKQMEAYLDFSGGLNTVSANNRLLDNEIRDIKNLNLDNRGSMSRRGGLVKTIASQTGTPQGYFRFYRDTNDFDEIVAIGGKFYVNGTVKIASGVTVQTIRSMEAVQYGDKLYIASGSGLLVWDGTNLAKAVPYTPNPLEALYVGYNGLADDPYTLLQDGTGTTLDLLGVTTSTRYGLVNQHVTLTAYSDIPSGMTVEYQFGVRKLGDTTWTIDQDWSTTKTWQFITGQATDFEFQVLARPQGDTNTVDQSSYYVPKFTFNESPPKSDIDNETINTCNRILLHWDRLIMYGDTSKTDAIYISQLENPLYFPMNNTLKFENPKAEGLTAITHYRDLLVAFTPTSIQSLTGKDPSTYVRTVLNTKIGCIAPYSTSIIDNYVAFLSYDGVYVLKTLAYTTDLANVQKIDINVDNIVDKDVNAVGLSFNNQYYLNLPSSNIQLRYYYQYGIWTKDESSKLNFKQYFNYNGELYALGNDGAVYRFDDSVYDDDGEVYEDYFETKGYDFGLPYNPKKLKELQLLMAHFNTTANIKVEAYADDSLALTTDQSYASIDENGNVVWNDLDESNLSVAVDSGTIFGTWKLGYAAFGSLTSSVEKFKLSGKCYYSKITMSHTEAVQNKILGLGFIYKVKKPK